MVISSTVNVLRQTFITFLFIRIKTGNILGFQCQGLVKLDKLNNPNVSTAYLSGEIRSDF